MPFLENTNPKNSSDLLLNSHFSLFSVNPTLKNLLNTASSASSCFFWVSQNTMISSLILITPWMSLTGSLITFWKISLAELVPKFSRLYLRNSLYVAKVVIYLLSGARDNWWYPDLKSNLENTVALLRECIKSSTVGLGTRYLSIALLAICILMRKPTSLFLLGIITNGEIHGVGPSTFLMMSSFSNLYSFISTCFLMWNGIRHAGCATGATDSSMCNITS